jgi:hypothetical protein
MGYLVHRGYIQGGTAEAVIINDPFITINAQVIAGDTVQTAVEKLQGQINSGSTGTGTVTSVSVINANGFVGVVTNPNTTPAISISTSVNGIIKGNSFALSSAIAGIDYSNGTSSLPTGILMSTTGTGMLSIAQATDFPVLNQNTTGNAATATVATTALNLSGTLSIAQGGTGANTANAALNSLLPLQAGNTNKVLQTDGSNTSWVAITNVVTSVNGQVGNVVLGLDNINDVTISSLQNAQVLIYDGASTSWVNENLSGDVTISNTGVTTLNNLSVINQILTGFSPTLGTVTDSDSILTAINKIAFTIRSPTVSSIHQINDYQMGVSNTVIIMDANNKTVTLPDATQVVIGQTYTLKLGMSAQTGSLVPPLGQTIDGGIYAISVNGAYNSLSAFSDGFNWFVC